MSENRFLSARRQDADDALLRELTDFLSEAPEYVCVTPRQYRRFAAGDFSLAKCGDFIEFCTGPLRVRIAAGTWRRATHRFVVRGRDGGILLKPSRKNELWLRRQEFRWQCEKEISRRWKVIRSGFAAGSANCGVFLRLILQKNARCFVAVAAADEEESRAETALAQLLALWNGTERKGKSVHGGLLFLSEHLAPSTARLASDLSSPIRVFQLPGPVEIAIPREPLLPLLWPSQRSRKELGILIKQLGLPPEVQVVIRSGREWSFEYHGIPFAVFLTGEQCWRLPLQENLLFPDEAAVRRHIYQECSRVRSLRRAHSRSRRDPLYQFYAERWIESLILQEPKRLDPDLRACPIYSQVPAYASRRRVIDIVGVTESGRLVVIEVKVHRSIDLLLQGLSYWRIVLQAQQQGGFQENGYFESLKISDAPPLLFCVTPLLSLHADQRFIARHLRPQVEAYLIGMNNDWRNGIKVLRKEKL